MARFAIAACLASLACGNTTSKPASRQPEVQQRIATPPTLTFSSPAAKYNEPSEPPPSSELGDAILAKVREAAARARRPSPTTNEGMFIAATAIASVVPEDGLLSYPIVEFAFQTNGVIEPSPHILVVWGQLDDPHDVADAVQRQLEQVFRTEGITRVGVGAVVRGARNYGAVVLALSMSRVRTSPIPRAVAADGVVKFEVTVERGLKPPQVWFVNPNGLVEQANVNMVGDRSFASIECGGMTGKMAVEITESGEVLARFPVWCGVDPPRTFKNAPWENDVPKDPADAERRIFVMVNRERLKLGRPPLAWDPDLVKSAREHSVAMHRADVVANRLPGDLAVAQRVRAIRPELTATSNVARAYGVTEAAEGLLGSPTIRAPLISHAATKIGIGIAYGRELSGGKREIYITQVVAARQSE